VLYPQPVSTLTIAIAIIARSVLMFPLRNQLCACALCLA
jgi:hypothetical protein